MLPPGKRYDVLVRWPRPGTHRLVSLPMSTGPAGDTYPGRRLATIRVGGPSARAVRWPRSLGALPRLGRAHVDRVRHVTFSENKAGSRYFINGRQFDATRVSEVVRLGATEEWVIRNTSKEQHPFHLHVDDFQVISVNGRPYHARGLQDTVPLPVGGTVRVRMRFRDYVGAFVFHCHILAHEDAGMMAVVDVNRNGRRPSARTCERWRRCGTRCPPVTSTLIRDADAVSGVAAELACVVALDDRDVGAADVALDLRAELVDGSAGRADR